ncbi:MAG: glutathione synthase [Deltaproteobacteria bacterium]|nr:glutathione synthase [Deltaproteobacteria bacterium]
MAALKIGFIIDPIETIRPDEDSTYLFMLEAQRRGHEIFYMTVPDLFMKGNRPGASGVRLEVFRDKEYYRLGKKKTLDLNGFDILFMRKDPPFNLEYYTATLILERVNPSTLVINDPKGLRNNNEKASTLRFPGLTPETLITHRIDQLQRFLDDVGGEMIVKSLFRSYGREVLYVNREGMNCNTLLEMATRDETRFVMAQRYLYEAADGDKRIILLNGEPVGAVLWLPPEKYGDKPPIRTPWREVKTELTERERFVCETIAPHLKENGLYFAGIDMIGGYLTEINITSPTCLHEINRLNHVHLEEKVIDFAEEEQRRRAASGR